MNILSLRNAAAILASSVLISIPADSQATYTNCIVGFSIRYEDPLDILTVNWDERSFTLKDGSNDYIQWKAFVFAERNLSEYSFKPNSTQRDSIFLIGLLNARIGCKSVSVDGSSEGLDSLHSRQYITSKGLRVLKFDLVYDEWDLGKEKKYTIGPFYIIDISKVNSARELIVSFHIGRKASQAEEKKLDKVVDSVSLL